MRKSAVSRDFWEHDTVRAKRRVFSSLRVLVLVLLLLFAVRPKTRIVSNRAVEDAASTSHLFGFSTSEP